MTKFPFLFGGTFIEDEFDDTACTHQLLEFPFLFGGTFIEELADTPQPQVHHDFPSFSEGLSLRIVPGLLQWLRPGK